MTGHANAIDFGTQLNEAQGKIIESITNLALAALETDGGEPDALMTLSTQFDDSFLGFKKVVAALAREGDHTAQQAVLDYFPAQDFYSATPDSIKKTVQTACETLIDQVLRLRGQQASLAAASASGLTLRPESLALVTTLERTAGIGDGKLLALMVRGVVGEIDLRDFLESTQTELKLAESPEEGPGLARTHLREIVELFDEAPDAETAHRALGAFDSLRDHLMVSGQVDLTQVSRAMRIHHCDTIDDLVFAYENFLEVRELPNTDDSWKEFLRTAHETSGYSVSIPTERESLDEDAE